MSERGDARRWYKMSIAERILEHFKGESAEGIRRVLRTHKILDGSYIEISGNSVRARKGPDYIQRTDADFDTYYCGGLPHLIAQYK